MADVEVWIRKNGLGCEGCDSHHYIRARCSGLQLFYTSCACRVRKDAANLIGELKTICCNLMLPVSGSVRHAESTVELTKDCEHDLSRELNYPLYRQNVSWRLGDCFNRPDWGDRYGAARKPTLLSHLHQVFVQVFCGE